MRGKLLKVSIFVVATMMSLMRFTVPAYAGTTEFTDNGYICRHQSDVNTGKTVSIIGYKGDETILSIPETLGGYEVVQIGDNAFKDNVSLRSITIPSTIAHIGAGAFSGCTSLSEVKLNEYKGKMFSYERLYIYTNAFKDCISLKNITIPKNTMFQWNPFKDSGVEEITVYGGSNISSAFLGMNKLKKINLVDFVPPNSWLAAGLGNRTFKDLPKLEEVNIYGEYMMTIDQNIVVNCPNLKKINCYIERPDNIIGYQNEYYQDRKTQEYHYYKTDNPDVINLDAGGLSFGLKFKIVGEGEATLYNDGSMEGDYGYTYYFYVGSNKKIDIADCDISLVKDSYVYTGNVVNARLRLAYKDTPLIRNKDYKISYNDNKAVGKATVTISGIGNYTGTVTKNYKILPQSCDFCFTEFSKDKCTLEWNKAASADGYELYYAKKKSGKYSKLATVKGGTKYSSDKLKKGYYIKIRAYKIVGGEKYYSAYSTAENI